MIFEKAKDLIFVELATQKPNAILLVPVLVAIGIGWYFSLMTEPFWGFSLFAFVFSFVALFFTKGLLRLLALAALCIAVGFAAAQLRTHLVHTPMLLKPLNFVDVEGRITNIETLEKGVRLTLSDVVLESVEPHKTPRKIRLKLWQGEGISIGQRVRGLASLNPPSPPVIPHGFDFQRYMYFRGIGAVGFLYKPPDILENTTGHQYVSNLRQLIGERIEFALDAPESGLARALMVGQRTSIDEQDMEAIRAAGLAHMLAISGLHIGLFSGVIFFSARLLMALFQSFALRHPIKKYAAIIAMIGAFFYMLIAGATIPTQRAMITVAVVFTAILLDRSPISLRVVAFAALCVLLIFPESLTSASFQMSFAAVAGLVGFYDWTRPLWSKWARQAGLFRKAGLYFVGVASTTIVATLVTAPLTLYHFQALPSYGLLANIVCVPLLGFAIMPLAILAFVFMPFGLEGYVFTLMDPALSVILDLARWVAGLEGAVLHIPAFSNAALVFITLLGLALIILRAQSRIMFASIFAVCILFNFKWIQYDVLISSKFDLIAMYTDEPYLNVSDKRKSSFMRENWKQAMGLEESVARRFPNEGTLEGKEYELSCDVEACRYAMKDHKISYLKVFDPQIYMHECAWADVVISQDVYKSVCQAEYVLNRRDGFYHGVHAFKFDGITTLERVEDFRGDRPWVQVPRKRQ